jgi:hypothetical protein
MQEETAPHTVTEPNFMMYVCTYMCGVSSVRHQSTRYEVQAFRKHSSIVAVCFHHKNCYKTEMRKRFIAGVGK